MRAVVSNTSPLQYLYQADALFLLPELFGRIFVPQAVADEILAGRQQNVPLPDLDALPWLEVHPIQQRTLLPLVTHLGSGEKEVLALGLEVPDSLLILDDRNARRHARQLSLPVTGTLGVLLLGKNLGKLDSVRPILDRLDALGFRLASATRRHVLLLVNE